MQGAGQHHLLSYINNQLKNLGQVSKLWLSCYLVLLSIDSKTRLQDSHSFVTWPICLLQTDLFDRLGFFPSHGAVPTIPDYRHRRVLHQAAVTPDSRFFKLLCQTFSTAIMETENEEGATALMLACQKEAVDQVDALLKKSVSFIKSGHVQHCWGVLSW